MKRRQKGERGEEKGVEGCKNRRGEEIEGKRLGEAWERRGEWKSHRGQGGTLQASVGSSSSDTPTSKQPPAASPAPAVSISVTYALSSTLFTDATSRPCKERKAPGLSTSTRRAEISVVVGGIQNKQMEKLEDASSSTCIRTS